VQFRYADETRGEVSILHHAVTAGEFDVVKALIDKGTNVDLLDLDGKTPLLLAAEYGHREITEFLIGRGAKATISSPSGQYPLHHLWMYDNDDVQVIAKRLVREAGANVNASMKEADSSRNVFYGFQLRGTALHVAISMRSRATVTALLEVGADVNAQPYDTLPSPLELAAINHTPEMVQLLLDHGAKLVLDPTHGSWTLHEVGRHVAPLQR
jgi:ankyrin repeat protein